MPDGSNINKELTTLAEEIETAKSEDAELGGRIKANEDRLKEEFHVKTLKAAESLKAKEMTELQDMEEELQTKFTHLKETYEW